MGIQHIVILLKLHESIETVAMRTELKSAVVNHLVQIGFKFFTLTFSLNAVIYRCAWKETVLILVISPYQRGFKGDHSLTSIVAQHSPGLTTAIFPISLALQDLPLQISVTLERNKNSRPRGNKKKCDEAAARYLPKKEFQECFHQWKRTWINCVSPEGD